MKLSQISVIIPYYEASSKIENVISKIIKAGFKAEQIKIINDSPHDKKIKAILKKFPEVKHLKNRKNLGAGYTRNAGIKKSSSRYLFFIDPDLTFSDHALKLMLGNYPKADIIFPKKVFENGSMLSPRNSWERKYCMASGVFLVRKQALKKLDELFDEVYFLYGEDNDFFLRCKIMGLNFKYVPNSVFKHPKKMVYSETIYYLRTRNVIYFSLKFIGIVNYRISLLVYLFGFTFINFLMAILNKHIDFFPVMVGKNTFYSKSSLPGMKLLSLFLKAIYWNVQNFHLIIEKRNNIRKAIKKLQNS